MPFVPKHRYIANLPPEFAEKVNSMLRGGQSYNDVVRLLHGAGLYADISFDTLKKAVQRYANDLFPNNVFNDLVKIGAVDLITRLGTKVDALDEMYKLVHMQRIRMDRAISAENRHNIVTKAATTQIQLMHDLVTAVAKIQLETGILQRATKVGTWQPPSVDGEATFRVTEEETKVLEAWKQESDESEVYDTRNDR